MGSEILDLIYLRVARWELKKKVVWNTYFSTQQSCSNMPQFPACDKYDLIFDQDISLSFYTDINYFLKNKWNHLNIILKKKKTLTNKWGKEHFLIPALPEVARWPFKSNLKLSGVRRKEERRRKNRLFILG